LVAQQRDDNPSTARKIPTNVCLRVVSASVIETGLTEAGERAEGSNRVAPRRQSAACSEQRTGRHRRSAAAPNQDPYCSSIQRR